MQAVLGAVSHPHKVGAELFHTRHTPPFHQLHKHPNVHHGNVQPNAQESQTLTVQRYVHYLLISPVANNVC